MAFGIFGKWGAGKSTAMHRLHAMVKDQLGDVDGRVTMSHYAAPVWEAAGNAQATIAYNILDVVDHDALFRVVTDEGRAPIVPGADDDDMTARFLSLAKAFAQSPILHQQWMTRISRRLQGTVAVGDGAEGGHGAHVHLVLVDDLDRCGPRFTADVLAATTFWDTPGQVNIFFVLAASEEHLLRSLEKHLPLGLHTPAEALEKYVHLSVNVPEMLTTPGQVANYMVALCDHVRGSGVSAEQIAELKDLISRSAIAYPSCVMAPLLQTRDGLTPRAAKHRFNMFLAEFRPHGALDEEDVKQWVLKAFWPEFWWRYLWQLGKSEDNANQDRTISFLARVTAYGKTLLPLVDLREADLVPVLRFLAAGEGIDLGQVDPALAVYMAADPAWQEPAVKSGIVAALRPAIGPRDAGDETSPDAPELELLRQYFLADQAEDRNDQEEVAAALVVIVELVESGRLGRASAPTVGNAALLAERVGRNDVARGLHLAANSLDPGHFNVMQNLIQYVIDAQDAEMYPLAEHLLDTLGGRGAAHRPERTMSLGVQLARRLGREVDTTAVDDLIAGVLAEPSVAKLSQVTALGSENVGFDAVLEIGQVVGEAADNDDDRYRVVRTIADFVAESDDARHERAAADMYRFLLDAGLAGRHEASQEFAVWHNMALVQASLGDEADAAFILKSLYDTHPEDQRVRRGLAVILDSLGQDKAAAAVLLGQSVGALNLPEPVVIGYDVPNPWWRRLEVADHPPCVLGSGRTSASE